MKKFNLYQCCLAIAIAEALFLNQNALACEKPTTSENYSSIACLTEGLAKVEQDKKYGFINQEGKVIIPMQYDAAWYFSNGIARVKKNNLWGFIDKDGKEVLPIQYDYIESNLEGLSKVSRNERYGLIDKTGKVVIPIQYDAITHFSSGGLAAVKQNAKWGFVDKTGKVIIPIQYDRIINDNFPRNGNKVQVVLNGERFYIDTTGKRLP